MFGCEHEGSVAISQRFAVRQGRALQLNPEMRPSSATGARGYSRALPTVILRMSFPWVPFTL